MYLFNLLLHLLRKYIFFNLMGHDFVAERSETPFSLTAAKPVVSLPIWTLFHPRPSVEDRLKSGSIEAGEDKSVEQTELRCLLKIFFIVVNFILYFKRF